MNKLGTEKRMQVVAALVKGSSVNSTVRMTGVSKPTILKLFADLGTACAKYQDEKLRNLSCKRVHADEIWSFCFAKDKNLSEEMKGKFGFGSVWTWTAICADTKLMISWLVGCCGTRTHNVTGNPDGDHTSTSFAERMNLQIRMDMRRFTRLTNAHSKKVENHRHALSLYFMYYNFARIHSTLRVTPAMQ